MRPAAQTRRVAIIVALLLPQALRAERQPIDVAHSKLSVHVFKSGLFSAFAHDHEIEAPIAEGNVDTSANTVTLRLDARKLRVMDPEVSLDTRSEIQRTMEGPMVLDVEHFPEIAFESTGVESSGEDHWRVRGDLTLHGKTAPVIVDISLQDVRYRGSATVKQRDFGIRPVSIAGGSVKVKDEVRIEFDIVLAQYARNRRQLETVSQGHLQQMYLGSAVAQDDPATVDCRRLAHKMYEIVATSNRKCLSQAVFDARNGIRSEANGAAPDIQDNVATWSRIH